MHSELICSFKIIENIWQYNNVVTLESDCFLWITHVAFIKTDQFLIR